MKELNCKVAQKGFCAGKIVLLREPTEVSFALADNVEAEKQKLSEIIAKKKAELKDRAAAALPENAKILEADIMLLEDTEFSDAILKILEEKKSKLSYAIQEGSRDLAERFEKNTSDYIKQRAADVRGLGKMLLDDVENRRDIAITEPCVVAAEEMTPEWLSRLDRNKLLGLITIKGAASSHVSIMAGNMGIPYVYDIPSLSDLTDGGYVIVDTGTGKIIADPDEETKNKAELAAESLHKEQQKAVQAARNVKLKTKIYVNISNLDDLDAIKDCGAEGVGLFRSEFLYLSQTGAPDEEGQYEAYTAVIKAAEGKEVIIRTMDIGSDKKASWLDMPEEKNPALGTRGIRFALRRPELFRTQLRALLRAATAGNMKIMFPMIASEWEVDTLKNEVKQVAETLEKEKIAYRIPPMGIMIETPAAAIIADKLAKKVDFFSIGTNDLTQYTIALDREAEGLEAFYQPHHEALIRLIGNICEAAHNEGIPVAVCGELGSDPEMIPLLIGAGVDELSVAAAKVLKVRICAAAAEKELYLDIACPCDGQVIPMEEISDPAFASGMLGQAIGVIPNDSYVYAPIEGKLISLAPTKHAFTLEDKDGKQVLVHVGIDTVKLGGKCFEALINAGDTVSCGQAILKVDFASVRESGYDPTVVVILLK